MNGKRDSGREEGEEKRTNLEVLRTDTPRQLQEQLDHDLLELGRLDHVQNLLDLVQEHDLLRRVDLGPIPQQPLDNVLGQARVLLEELHNAVRQLRVVQRETLDLVQGNQDAREERLVLLLEREGEPVNDRPEDLEQLGDTVVSFGLVDELVEDVVDRPTDEGAEVEELAVDAVEGRLEEIALAGVFAVEELEELRRKADQFEPLQGRGKKAKTNLQDETLIDIPLRDVCVEVGRLDKSEEEFIDDLEMRPGKLENWLVLLRVIRVSSRVDGRRDGAEQVRSELCVAKSNTNTSTDCRNEIRGRNRNAPY
jgi:hypothetical protein